MLGKECIKSWARLQQSVALSSAESELYALVEGSREALGARCAVGHILGHEGEIDPHIYCDSEAAVNISKMEGGCPYQRLNLNRYGTEYQKHLDGLCTVHRKLWSVVKIMCNLSDHWAVEWPARCAYWKQTESFFERLSYPVHTSYVDGCAAGLRGNDGLPIAKRWRVMVTDARLEEASNGASHHLQRNLDTACYTLPEDKRLKFQSRFVIALPLVSRKQLDKLYFMVPPDRGSALCFRHAQASWHQCQHLTNYVACTALLLLLLAPQTCIRSDGSYDFEAAVVSPASRNKSETVKGLRQRFVYQGISQLDPLISQLSTTAHHNELSIGERMSKHDCGRPLNVHMSTSDVSYHCINERGQRLRQELVTSCQEFAHLPAATIVQAQCMLESTL
ncbi:hypothetical protein AK812_SmicGene35223 [Symbiodinium microadriaticum]|uniref:Uncharacterized protein n=1 Tax=Symbiodinium microadriaticum TaxID=2951 RepID=A0A1Q9CM13_SYMMI|nr:hypothetical protein AK812_SmicGene35223 [Symbiodinium microadriaticum]